MKAMSNITGQYTFPLLFILFLGVNLFFSACSKEPCKDKVCPDCAKTHFQFVYQDTAKKYCDSTLHVGTTIEAFSITNLTDTGVFLYRYGFQDSCTALLLPNPNTRYIITNPSLLLRDTVTILKINRVNGGISQDAENCCYCFPIEQVQIKFNNQPPENADMRKIRLITT